MKGKSNDFPIINLNKFITMDYTENKLKGDAQMCAYESKDAYVLDKIYENLKGTDYYSKEYPRWSHVDLYSEITNEDGVRVKWNTEIKSANVKRTTTYPSFKLKEQKLNDCFSVSSGVGLYIVFLDYYDYNAYIYNAKKIDWDKIEKRNDYQLIRYVQPELGYSSYPTYFLPKDKANKIINFKNYSDEYD